MVPIESEIQIVPCTDNFPQWRMTITFADDTKITFDTTSNFLSVGGPWETTIDGQTYIQYSSAIPEKIGNLVKALELPVGEPFAMSCFGDSVFEKAFSGSLPSTSTSEPNPEVEAIFTAAAQTVEAMFSQTAQP